MPALADDLARIPLFSDLNKRQLRKLAGGFKEVTAGTGTTLVREGQNSGVGFFVIADGTATVSVGGKTVAHHRPRRLLRRARDDHEGRPHRDRHRRDAAPLPLDPVLGLPPVRARRTPTSPGSFSSTSPACWRRIAPGRPRRPASRTSRLDRTRPTGRDLGPCEGSPDHLERAARATARPDRASVRSGARRESKPAPRRARWSRSAPGRACRRGGGRCSRSARCRDSR